MITHNYANIKYTTYHLFRILIYIELMNKAFLSKKMDNKIFIILN